MEAAAGNAKAAREKYQAAVQAEPRMPHAYAAWARLEASHGDYDKARQLFKEGADITSGNPPLLHAWAQMELQLGRTPMAKQLLQQGLQGDPGHIPCCMSLGEVEWLSGAHDTARKVWQQGVQSNGGACAPLLCFWAHKEAHIHNHRRARELLAAARQADPTHARSAVSWAALEDRSGDKVRAGSLYADAVTALAQDVHCYPTSSGSSAATSSLDGMDWPVGASDGSNGGRSSASAVSGNGSNTSAPAASQKPPRPNRLLSKPSPATSSRDSEQVAPDSMGHEACNTSQPMPVHLLHAMAAHKLRQGQRQEALALLAQVEQQDPRNGHMCHTRGVLAQQEGLGAEAREWFLRGIQSSDLGGCLLCWEGLAELLSFLGQPDSARRAFQQGAAAAAKAAFTSQPALPFAGSSTSAPSSSASVGVPGPGSAGMAAAPAPSLNSGAGSSEGCYPGLTSRFLRQWALLEKKTGNADKAEALFRAASTKDPQDYKTWLAWAVFERRRGRIEAAERAFQCGVEVAPGNPHMWYAYGSMVWKVKGDLGAARAIFHQATRRCPRAAPLWMEWALMEWRGAGDRAVAAGLFQQGANVPPAYQHAPLYEAWAQMEGELGNKDSVRSLLVAAESLALKMRARPA
uniref:Suppressor of forked domain-containing protein n=1 Tax=Chlamydomonas leiostraca TaxID=1034604 RepID=A0A7S0WPT8_9CHLO|mmetsp:Transcript_2183/g.5543  ORF Transcript_2183/g.5543 Transcript_2183/m.5543 type:complete len:632 (+) Transcript_2183:758-2653(+)